MACQLAGKDIALVYSISSSVLASIFVGFSQCGGYAWHWQALEIHTVACCVLLAFVFREPWPRGAIRAVVAIGLLLGIVWFGLCAGLSLYLGAWTWDPRC